MRELLSDLFVKTIERDGNTRVLSSDHGYSLFDDLRAKHPDKFVNTGIIEQGMIGIAAGLAQNGFRPIVYGLSSFIPMRCLEQIKLDLCHANLPVILIGDGAGLVYSTLGVSHHCAEDIAVLRCIPNISIYSPCDRSELQICWDKALKNEGPTYIRIGKCDLPEVDLTNYLGFRSSYHINAHTALVATGSMVSKAKAIGDKLGLRVYSMYELKPFAPSNFDIFGQVIVLEEHSKHGGLYSIIKEHTSTKVHSIALEDKFADKTGDWQYALSEHRMDDENLFKRVEAIVNDC